MTDDRTPPPTPPSSAGGGAQPSGREAGSDRRTPSRYGAYELAREIGHGATGTVYEAVHRERGSPEALKILAPELGADPDLAARIQGEIRVLAALDHPHIVPLYDVGVVDGRPYLAMRLMPGVSVAALLAEIRALGEMPPRSRANAVLNAHGVPPAEGEVTTPESAYVRRMAGMLVGVADALAAAHAAGVLHLDVKPSNLLLNRRGQAVLTDFAQVRSGAQAVPAPGDMRGTPAYRSPEQLDPEAEDVDERADVYGLGATLYEMLTLRPPHRGASIPETIERVLDEDVEPVGSINRTISSDAQALVSRALERLPEERYATVAAMRDDLAELARGQDIDLPPLGATVRVRNRLHRHRKVLGVAVLFLGAFAAWWLTRPAQLTLRTTPSVDVLLDGEEIGRTPVVERDVGVGQHEVVLRRADFRDVVRTFEVGHRDAVVLDVCMPAKDPADLEVIRLMGAARGLEPSALDVPRTRGPEGPVVTALLPRGRVRGPPRRLRLYAARAVQGYQAILEQIDEAEAPRRLHAWPVPEQAGELILELPASLEGRVRQGETYWLRVVDETGSSRSAAKFVIMSAAAAADVEERLAAVGRGFEPDDPLVEFLTGELMIRDELYRAAWERAEALRARFGDRRSVLRLGLATLAAAGLRDQGPWAEWAAAYHAAER